MGKKNEFGNQLLDAMNAVDEKVIEQAGQSWGERKKTNNQKGVLQKEKRKPWTRYRIALTAACAVLILGIGGYISNWYYINHQRKLIMEPMMKQHNCVDGIIGSEKEEATIEKGKTDTEDKMVPVGSEELLETYKLQETIGTQTCGTCSSYADSGWELNESQMEALVEFCQDTMYPSLSQGEGENTAYSPINLYMASSMLAEMAGGETRQQFLDLLGEKDTSTLANQNSILWEMLCDLDSDFPCKLANSLWVREDLLCKKSTIRTLATSYHASSYQGEVGEKMDQAIQAWVNRETGGKLKKEAKAIQTKEDTACVLMSTLHLQDQWVTPFDESVTTENQFIKQNGELIMADFMNQTIQASVLEGKNYLAASLPMEGSRKMQIILPEEGTSMEEFMKKNGEEALSKVCGSEMREIPSSKLTLSLPKFSFHSTLDMVSVLQGLGVQDAFSHAADFSGLQTDELRQNGESKIASICIDKVRQSSVISIDEAGCSVDSFLEVTMREKGGILSSEKSYTMNCNRPFLFVITSGEGIPIFMGVVNQPS